MGTLYIDRKDLHVRLDGNALAFYASAEREGTVPVGPLKRVVFVGTISVETNVLGRLADEGVSVIFLSGKRHQFRGALHGRLHNNAILRVLQYKRSVDETFSREIATDIVLKKISNQMELLESAKSRKPECRLELSSATDVLANIVNTIENECPAIESLRGYEGGASASYFKAFTGLFPPSLKFNRRTRRPPTDPVNAMLSLAYTLMHFEIVRELEVIGLDPYIGFYHQFDYGRESLACDLVETFRPHVDSFVWDMFRQETFTKRDFVINDKRPGCYMNKRSRKKFYPLYEEWAKRSRPLWGAEVRLLARRINDGSDIIHK